MLAKSKLTVAAFALLLCFVGESPTAKAQGILQRLGDRIRSRIVTPPFAPPRINQPQPNTANPSADTEPSNNTSRYNPYPNRGSQQAGLRPSTGAPGSETRSGQASTGEPTLLPEQRSGRRSAAGDSNLQPIPDPQADNDLGGSILGPSLDPSDSVDSGDAVNDGDSRPRATIGIRVLDPRPDSPSVQVVSFNPESKADEAGMQPGDAILAIDGVRTPNIASIASLLSNRNPGETVRVYIGRENRTMLLPVQLVSTSRSLSAKSASAPSDRIRVPDPGKPAEETRMNRVASNETDASKEPLARPAVLGIDVEEPKGSRGAFVVAVQPDSPAELFGIQVGDRIVAVDHRFVVDTISLESTVSSRRDPLTPMPVKLVRDDELVDLIVHFDGSATPSAGEPASDASKSILGGIGSTLGSLLGGKTSQSNASASAKRVDSLKPATQVAQIDTEQLRLPEPTPLPSAVKSIPPTEQANATQANAEKDLLDFGDSEPINQVIFQDRGVESLPAGNMQARAGDITAKDNEADKVSLANPSARKSKAVAEKDAVLRELRAEIERLQERLESLEKSEKD